MAIEELNDKEKLIRVIQKLGKKRRVKSIEDRKLKVGGLDSKIFAESEILNYSRTREDTDNLRNKIKNIVDQEARH